MSEVNEGLDAALARISELKVRQATTSILLILKPINTGCSQLENSQYHREAAGLKGLLTIDRARWAQQSVYNDTCCVALCINSGV